MPPITKITKQMILEAGYELVRDNGIESVNSRNIAKVLGCSTQPIFSQFSNMDELKQEIHDFACSEIFESGFLEDDNSESFFHKGYMGVINLAKSQPNIFKLIFLTEHCSGDDFINSRMSFECNRKILNEMKERYNINNKESEELYEKISLLVHGIATIISTSNIKYDDEHITNIVETTLTDLISGIKERRKNK